jgi:hypothetical protein
MSTQLKGGIRMAQYSGATASWATTTKNRSELAPDIMRLLDILVKIELRRQERLRATCATEKR